MGKIEAKVGDKMDIKKFFKNIPLLPLSAIIFYFVVLILVKIGILPPPPEIINFLEKLYENYGLISLFIASILEGIVYLGLYFSGSFIIVLIVLFSDGKFTSLLSISLIVTFALTLTSLINYVLGRHIISKPIKESKEIEKRISKGLILSAIHPNFLAFYFFNLGLKKDGIEKIIFVPIIMIPYGLLLAFLITSLKSLIIDGAENPYILITALLIWLVIAFILKNRSLTKK